MNMKKKHGGFLFGKKKTAIEKQSNIKEANIDRLKALTKMPEIKVESKKAEITKISNKPKTQDLKLISLEKSKLKAITKISPHARFDSGGVKTTTLTEASEQAKKRQLSMEKRDELLGNHIPKTKKKKK